MQGFLSRDGLPPSELLAIGRAEVTSYGVELIDDVVVSVDPLDPGFTVRLSSGQVLITAAGAGSAAAIAINADLLQDDIALAVHTGQ